MADYPVPKRTPKRNRPIQKAKRVINKIVRVLQQKSFQEEVGIETTEVFLGGSVGQGTAITHHYDLDLVLYSRSIKYKEALSKDYYDNLKKKINAYLTRKLSPNYTFLGQTRVAVQFKYKLPEQGYLSVDLLLSPYWDSQESYWRDLAQIHPPLDRLTFSVSTSKYQTDFIKTQWPQRVQELIRRAKAWRNVTWQDNDKLGKPKSYLISLLVIAAYDRVPNKQGYFRGLAREVGQELVKLVGEIATDKELDLTIPGTDALVTTSDLLPPCPRIVDPVNPANNVYLSGVGHVARGEGKWQVFSEEIPSIDITITAERIMATMAK